MTATREPEILEQEVAPTLPVTAGGTVDVQVSTARRFPRSITTFVRRATEMATLTPEIAASCVYAMPRDGKTIEGPSARLAEIVASAWGNLRIQAGATENDDRYVTARGEAWDVETNVAIGFEVKRRITTSEKKGRNGEILPARTYSDDMIAVTGNAAASIALRNAVFKAVPSPFWRPIYLKCRQVIAGDAKTFASRRDDMLKAFMVVGVTPERLCAGIGLKGTADISLDHMATLVGILNALKEGETTVEEAFPEVGQAHHAPQPAQRKSQQSGAAKAEPPKAQEPPASTSPTAGLDSTAEQANAPADAPASVGTIADIKDVGNGVIVTLSTGFKAATANPAFVRSLKDLREKQRVIDLGTRPSRDPQKYHPAIDDITPMPEEDAGQ